MSKSAIFSTQCPACGAPVQTYSATSVVVVCEYCHTTLWRKDNALINSGVKSALLEDFSPIQLQTSGVYNGLAFTVIGRLQIRYSRGMWNEWYVIFSDGQYGWLADFSGQYILMRLTHEVQHGWPFDQLTIANSTVTYQNKLFVVTDKREAVQHQAAAQGELPYFPTAEHSIRVADFRYENEWITADYATNNTVTYYAGKAVTLTQLHCQHLRSQDEIIKSAGRLKGQVQATQCKQCGGAISCYPGVAEYIACQHCGSQLTVEGDDVTLLSVHTMREAQMSQTTLKIGDTAYIGGTKWVIIGVMRISELDQYNTLEYMQNRTDCLETADQFWFEYLLYQPNQGFQWLVEYNRRWQLVKSVKHWPDMTLGHRPMLAGKTLQPRYQYGGVVDFAAGAFYWQVEKNDVTYYEDYYYHQGILCAEITTNEFNFSLAREVKAEELSTWFKRPELKEAVDDRLPPEIREKIGRTLMTIFWILNTPLLLMIFFTGGEFLFLLSLSVCFIVYWIVWIKFCDIETDKETE